MKSPVIIFALFIIAAAAIIVVNKKTPPPTKRAVIQKAITFEPGTPLTTVLFIDSVQNMGKVKDGEKLNIAFHFTNTDKRC